MYYARNLVSKRADTRRQSLHAKLETRYIMEIANDHLLMSKQQVPEKYDKNRIPISK